jgi:hypothetical protein
MTATATARPTLRLVPAPRLDPPYDDEREPAPPMTVGSLALAFPAADTLPLRLVPPARPRPDAAEGAGPPEPQQWARRFTQAIVEVLAGARPAAQLSRFTTLDVLHQLERWSGRFGARLGESAPHPRVVSVHVCRPHAGAAEACATVDTGPRRRAFAFRLDVEADTWQCTALELG